MHARWSDAATQQSKRKLPVSARRMHFLFYPALPRQSWQWSGQWREREGEREGDDLAFPGGECRKVCLLLRELQLKGRSMTSLLRVAAKQSHSHRKSQRPEVDVDVDVDVGCGTGDGRRETGDRRRAREGSADGREQVRLFKIMMMSGEGCGLKMMSTYVVRIRLSYPFFGDQAQ